MITMKIEYGERSLEVVAWHEDVTQEGNYVLTLSTELGNRIQGVERKLTPEQAKLLQETVRKDSTGL